MLRSRLLPAIALCATLLAARPVAATWSIVVVDIESGEVAVGTVTCLNQFDLLALVPVVVVGKGGAAVQASGDFDGVRRPIIFQGLVNGTPVSDIFAQLEPISGHQSRQYGIVNRSGESLTFSGDDTLQWAGGVTGSQCTLAYAIQGNILAGGCVVPAIELALTETPGDLPDRLMAGMQAARLAGGDGRCSCAPNNPTGCGCPPPAFTKSGHIGGMVVARLGDSDDPVCNAAGCVDGDYLMRLNVAFQDGSDPDPVVQLQGQFDAWRASLAGRPDAVHSTASIDPPTLPPDGSSTALLTMALRDWQDLPAPVPALTVEHAPGSAGATSIGAVIDRGGGTWSVTLTAGAVTGVDRFTVTADDGIRPVLLMPEPALEVCDRDCQLDCNRNGVSDICDIGNGTSDDCNVNLVPDECELAAGAGDCDGNGVPDDCEDCNGNGAADACDLADGTSLDVDGNGVPDECHGIFLVPAEHATIQSALDLSEDGDTVLVSPGTWSGPGNTGLNFAGKAILLKSAPGFAAAVLDGGGTARIALFDDGEGRGSVIEGFTITNGSATSGGAISCIGSDPTIRGCLLTANAAGSLGGAISCSAGAAPLIERCRFIGNTAASRGGAVHSTSGSAPDVVTCLLAGNGAGSVGGAVSVSTASVTIEGCTMSGNTAATGGGFYVTGTSSALVTGSILWADVAGTGPEIHLASAQSTADVSYSDVEGGQKGVGGPGGLVWGPGNIDLDPDFRDAGGGDWRLASGSTAIDAGDRAFVPGPGQRDLAGAARLGDGDGDGTAIVDMGAFERPCPGDLDSDGAIGITDLLDLLAVWGACPGCDADLDGDGLVGITDLLTLLAHWGPCGD